MLVCLSGDKNDSKNAAHGDESYARKGQQCRRCYWYHTAVNVITDGPQLEDSPALIKLMDELDDDLDIFKQPADQYFVQKLFAQNIGKFLKKKSKK